MSAGSPNLRGGPWRIAKIRPEGFVRLSKYKEVLGPFRHRRIYWHVFCFNNPAKAAHMKFMKKGSEGMRYDFDQMVDRSGNLSAKYDERIKKFGTEDVIPLWIRSS